ncbi:MAG: ergothioneine biosynthesis protein EgtB [Acidobacteriota bacterium]|nr:ergothioneine biosynthesis protein EgtB [Acidobacteriota bacterium]
MEAAVEQIAESLIETRVRTLALVRAIPGARLVTPPAAFMGPILWDLGHLAHFEELWILRRLSSRKAVDERFDRLYDASLSPRPGRSELDVPPISDTLAYMGQVRARVLELIERIVPDAGDPLTRDGYVFRMIVQHEIQHQETMLQSLQLAGEQAALGVIAAAGGKEAPERTSSAVDAAAVERESVEIPGGPFDMGTDRWAGTYDNERPRRSVHVDAFVIDRFPVTNRRFLEFARDDGYRRPELWCDAGWSWVSEHGVERPQGWEDGDDETPFVRRFGSVVPLAPDEPVQHVSWYEADAFAHWSGARLPTEAEWEKAAAWDPHVDRARRYPWGNRTAPRARANVGWKRPGPAPIGAYRDGASPLGVEQLVGDVYEWTSSLLDNHERFEAFPYREYSEAFFGTRYRVLRGASWAVHDPMVRCTYRNWDLPQRRQLFAGFRLARGLS